ncbi:MAG: GNAT family N-acetyltransferase [Wenzhouxiangella sp.]
MSDKIKLQPELNRFLLRVDDWDCVLEFTIQGQVASFNSVRVPSAVGGQGIAGRLTRYALDWARDQKLKVIPRCPYVASWIERHPDYADLVA